MTTVDVSAPVPAETASLVDVARFLPSPARPAGPDRWVVEFAVGPFGHEAVVTLGPLWRSGARSGRAIRWSAATDDHDALPWERLFPPVHGVLVLEDAVLGLRVRYTPRAGVVGRLVDLALRPVARASVAGLLQGVARAMARGVAAPAGRA